MDRLSVSSWQSGRADWEHLHQQAAAALQQSWAYGDALAAHGVVVQRLVVRRGDTPVALAQFIQRKLFAGLGVSLCARGPVWLEPLADEECARSMHLLRAVQPLRWPSITVMSPDQAADGERPATLVAFAASSPAIQRCVSICPTRLNRFGLRCIRNGRSRC